MATNIHSTKAAESSSAELASSLVCASACPCALSVLRDGTEPRTLPTDAGREALRGSGNRFAQKSLVSTCFIVVVNAASCEPPTAASR